MHPHICSFSALKKYHHNVHFYQSKKSYINVSLIPNDSQETFGDTCLNICITAPLKGIPKAPFRSPTAPSIFSPPSNRTPIAPARTPLRKERGVKVISYFQKCYQKTESCLILCLLHVISLTITTLQLCFIVLFLLNL